VEAATHGQLRSGEVEVRPAEYLAVAGGQPLNLTARELELLSALIEREGRIVSREELYRTVWGEPYRKSDRSVDVYVGKLRQKLDDAMPGKRFIHTHFGFGYRFQAQPAENHLTRLS
jgi:DNA-binding response OmpR family regulator